jgi:prepilin-type N-terminal cleavage/methylation domain-containing protein
MIPKKNHMRWQDKSDGFSLIELLVSLTVLLVIAGVALSALSYVQKLYSTQQSQADMHAGLRGSFELLTQEIGQAGALGSVTRTLTPTVNSSGSAQNVPISSTADIFVGEKLTVDTGNSQEIVTVTAIGSNQITAVFSKSHSAGAAVVTQGVFPQGVLSSSTATSLKIVGDINADGTLAYVQYDCDTTAGTLTRSITTLNPGVTTRNASQTLLTNLVANPGGTPCFQYGTAVSVTVSSTTYTFIPSVAISLTVQTSKRDPQTGAFVTMTKSFSNLSSRNILAGLDMVQASPPITNRLQATPPGLPLGP